MDGEIGEDNVPFTLNKQHKTKQRYTCEQCDRHFKKPCELRAHMNMHTGAELFACDECDKSFHLRNSLYGHKKFVHRGVRLHACKQCDKRFTSAIFLERHLHTHTGAYA